jgi:hypothetical protein
MHTLVRCRGARHFEIRLRTPSSGPAGQMSRLFWGVVTDFECQGWSIERLRGSDMGVAFQRP